MLLIQYFHIQFSTVNQGETHAEVQGGFVHIRSVFVCAGRGWGGGTAHHRYALSCEGEGEGILAE